MDHLEAEIQRAIREGAKPFLVSATAGTTVLGAFDPINDIANLCEKYNLWLHVDCAWGGGALMSQKHRSLFNGIERLVKFGSRHELDCRSQLNNPHFRCAFLMQFSF